MWTDQHGLNAKPLTFISVGDRMATALEIQNISEMICSKFSPQKIILFGSHIDRKSVV